VPPGAARNRVRIRQRELIYPVSALRRICVYCGSSTGSRDVYASAALELARLLVRRDVELVYGGASKGIMGVLADAVLEAGGRVHGVIPKSLVENEIAHERLTELHVTESMHERKSMMAVLSDGFIAMPGGFGTLEEIIEVLTWGQLQFHSKPCGLLNVDAYFDRLLDFVAHAEDEGFVRPQHGEMLLVDSDPGKLLGRFDSYQSPQVRKWTTR